MWSHTMFRHNTVGYTSAGIETKDHFIDNQLSKLDNLNGGVAG